MSPTPRFLRAAAHWPQVRVDAARFEQWWAERAAAEPVDEALEADVYLAAGIEAGDRAALAWLAEVVQRAARGEADVAAEVVAKVAVGAGDGPAIRGYQAKGPLAGWLKVVTARALRARVAGPQVSLEDVVLEELGRTSATPDGQLLAGRVGPHLRPALNAATGRLGARDRALLTLHYLRGVGLDELARSYQVHRVTVSRWLADARARFLEAVRDELAARAGLQRLEVDSLVRGLQSQLDLSLQRLWDTRAKG